MIHIIIPTLNPARGKRTGELAIASSGLEPEQLNLIVVHDENEERFTKTVNRGLNKVVGKLGPKDRVCILNDDIKRFQLGWLRILNRTLRRRRGGAVCPTGKSHTSPMKFGKPGEQGVVRVHSIPFWCILISRNAIKKVGILDERYVHFASDNDWCERAKRQGFMLLWDKSVYLWHQGHGSGRLNHLAQSDSKRFRKQWR